MFSVSAGESIHVLRILDYASRILTHGMQIDSPSVVLLDNLASPSGSKDASQSDSDQLLGLESFSVPRFNYLVTLRYQSPTFDCPIVPVTIILKLLSGGKR